MRIRAGLCLLALLAPYGVTRGGHFEWQTSAGELWSDAQNWAPSGGPPGANDSACFHPMLQGSTVLTGDVSVQTLEYDSAQSWAFEGAFSLSAGQLLCRNTPELRLGCFLAGSGQVEIDNAALFLDASGGTFAGTFAVQPGGALYVIGDGSLGLGSRTWVAPGASMYIYAAQTYADNAQAPTIELPAGANLTLEPGGSVRLNLRLAGGRLDPWKATQLLGGVTLLSDFNVNISHDLTLSGALDDEGRGLKISKARGQGALTLASANDFTGGTVIRCGAIEASAGGSLGGGSVVVGGGAVLSGGSLTLNGGTLRLLAPAALAPGATVTAGAEGIVELAAAQPGPVYVNSGAALVLGAAAPAAAYGQDVHLQRGAILSVPADKEPSRAYVAGLGGPGDFGLYQARGGTLSGSLHFGDDGSGIWRGLAAMAGAPLTLTGSASSVAGSGLWFHALAGSSLTLDGAAGCRFDPGDGTVHLDGAGATTIRGPLGGSFSRLTKSGQGPLIVEGAGGLGGRQVDVDGGYLQIKANQSLDGAFVTIHDGGLYLFDLPPTGAKIRIAGGAVWYTMSDMGPLAATTIEPGSQLAFDSSVWRPASAGLVAGAGMADYLPPYSVQVLSNCRLELGQGRRITVATHATPDPDPEDVTISVESGAWGVIALAPGAGEARLAMPAGFTMTVEAPLDFGGGTLVVGDSQPYATIITSGKWGRIGLDQAGQVRLTNPANVIGAVRVEAGRLTSDVAGLGGATRIELRPGARLELPAGSTLAAEVSGGGTIDVGGGQLLMRATGDGACLRPSGLTIEGDLSLLPCGDSGLQTRYIAIGVPSNSPVEPRIQIDFAGSPAGGDWGRLDIRGQAQLAQAQLVVSLPVPSVQFDPGRIGLAEIILAGGGLPGFAPGVTLAAGTDSHWAIDADDLLVEPGRVCLDIDGADWTALGGDADLSGSVDYLDLGVLAANYRRAASSWRDADFNFDGRVDYLDLGTLAGNYRRSEAGPPNAVHGVWGPPQVPEPAAMMAALAAVTIMCARRFGSARR